MLLLNTHYASTILLYLLPKKHSSISLLLVFITAFKLYGVPLVEVKIISDSLRVITARGETEKYIWEGTNQGLYRTNKSNGKRKFLTLKNSKLPDNYITSIACLIDGQTYIATLNGILFWDNYSFFLITTENSDLPENKVIDIKVGPGDALIIKTKSCGIFRGIGHCIKAYKLHRVVQ